MKRYKILDQTVLKIVAMVSMVFDHAGDNFFPNQTWMRIIGRIAMPIFTFCVCEGYIHTRDRKKYLTRMLIFALISEIPFDLVTSGKVLEFTQQNIMFTFAMAAGTLMLCDLVLNKFGKKTGYVLTGVIMLMSMVLSVVLRLDYSMTALAVVFVYYLLKDKALEIRNLVAMAVHFLLRNVGVYLYGVLGFIPLFLYNGKRGKGLKWLFYVFYPGHLLLIYLISRLVR